MNGVKCRWQHLQSAFTRIPDVLETRSDIIPGAFATYGLCMGGGYAYHAASVDARYRSCVTLFPLLINQVAEDVTPKWMKQSEWAAYQMDNVPAPEFIREMSHLQEGTLTCPFLFIHGQHDNWMTLETASHLFERAQGAKEKIIIEEQPVFSNQQAVTHTMPVGEQLHWIRHVAADWLVAHLSS